MKFSNFQDAPSPIALEPCSGNRAAVLSLLVRLPTGILLSIFILNDRMISNPLPSSWSCPVAGGLSHSPNGQSAGLAVASALVTLGNPPKLSIDHPKEPKSKRKQSQHPDVHI